VKTRSHGEFLPRKLQPAKSITI